MDAAPPAIIEIVKTEKHDVRAELVEYVARLLCRSDGKDPDRDKRVTAEGHFQTVHLPYPMNLTWYAYRDKAEELLQTLFRSKP